MSNHTPSHSPFNLEDWFAQVVWRDPSVQNSAKSSYYKFSLNQSNQNIFMSLKFSILKSFSQHVVLASLVTLTLIGGVAVGATELLAPEEYKPTNIIKKITTPVQNQVPDKNPYTALKPDKEYDVVNFKECDLAIKYPKKVENKNLEVLKGGPFIAYTEESNNPVEGVRLENSFIIECIDQKDLGPIRNSQTDPSSLEKLSLIFSSPKVYADSEPAEQFSIKPLSQEEFKNMTNWFIFEDKLTDIYEITAFDYSKTDLNSEKYIRFSYKDKVYFTYFRAEKLLQLQYPGEVNVLANQVQLQFNSLVKSEINAEIKQTPSETNKPSESSSTSSSSTSSQNSNSSVSTNTSASANKALQTYTNQYFPDFKLVYDNSWSLKTDTRPSQYAGLLSRDIFLSKNGFIIKLQLEPNHKQTCSNYNSETISTTNLGNNVYKSILKAQEYSYNFVFYGKNISCEFVQLESNIVNKNIKNYSTTFTSDKNVKYKIYFSVFQDPQTPSEGIPINPNSIIVPEIDQIISQSSFK